MIDYETIRSEIWFICEEMVSNPSPDYRYYWRARLRGMSSVLGKICEEQARELAALVDGLIVAAMWHKEVES